MTKRKATSEQRQETAALLAAGAIVAQSLYGCDAKSQDEFWIIFRRGVESILQVMGNEDLQRLAAIEPAGEA